MLTQAAAATQPAVCG